MQFRRIKFLLKKLSRSKESFGSTASKKDSTSALAPNLPENWEFCFTMKRVKLNY